MADRLLWIALAACPSVLWLGVANELSQNVAPIPLLWILPLSIYLLSFILCFDRQGWYRPAVYRVALPAGWLLMGYCLSRQGSTLSLTWVMVVFSAALFACCMFCHGELARRKPHPEQLTSYYLMLALGGALGGPCLWAWPRPCCLTGIWSCPSESQPASCWPWVFCTDTRHAAWRASP